MGSNKSETAHVISRDVKFYNAFMFLNRICPGTSNTSWYFYLYLCVVIYWSFYLCLYMFNWIMMLLLLPVSTQKAATCLSEWVFVIYLTFLHIFLKRYSKLVVIYAAATLETWGAVLQLIWYHTDGRFVHWLVYLPSPTYKVV